MESAIIPVLTGAGVAGVWVLTIIFGFMSPKGHVQDLKQDIADLKEAVRTERERADLERRRADSAEEAARTSNILLASLRGEVAHALVETQETWPDRSAVRKRTVGEIEAGGGAATSNNPA